MTKFFYTVALVSTAAWFWRRSVRYYLLRDDADKLGKWFSAGQYERIALEAEILASALGAGAVVVWFM